MISEDVSKALSGGIIEYINNRRDKKEEVFLKDKPKKNKQGVITNGAINTRVLVIIKTLSQNKTDISSLEKSKKTKEQTALVFQQDKYNQLLSFVDEDVINTQLFDVKNEYHEFLLKNGSEHEPAVWLTQWSIKAKDISFATHVGKLTHSSSKSSSILDVTAEKNESYLTTNSLNHIEVDTASSNAASLPIADILKITASGISILDCLKSNDYSLFDNLTNDKSLINEWCEQLKQAYDSSKKQSYFLSKQTYFPIEDNQYHLLLPLTSSSLVHELHLEHKKYWDKDQEVAREQKYNKKHSATVTRTYPNKAYLHVTGSNHSNASSLNGKRGGRISLLPTMPPQWQSNSPSYNNKSEIFDRTLAFELKNVLEDLRRYLQLIKNKELSISEPKRNAAVIKKLQAISNYFFNYIEAINSNTANSNWTCESKLPVEQQLLFEPCRNDEVAIAIKANKKWMKTLSRSYGRWLSKQLEQKNKLTLSPIHEALWADAFLIELREFIAIKEVTL